MRQKAAQPGMVTVQLPLGLARSLAAARASDGDTKVQAALDYIAQPGQQVSASGTLTDSGDQSKPATKAAAPSLKDLISGALDAAARNGGIH